MREIKFRGLGKAQPHLCFKYGYFYQEWHYGYPSHSIIRQTDGNLAYVDENTIGQYTGLQDKNGVDIYEGDILGDYGHKYKVDYDHGVLVMAPIGNTTGTDKIMYSINIAGYEVIGNIYQNPGLLD